ncbi:MlaE family ABC transporter permease [Mycobacteroides abscessus]|uniref:MlaE family ABC transporter permease n=1 Tax=Mycobacteroides abscessus TaxID=36809 RepID=UPI0009A8B1C7|nr:ABC transporter permease [Mycobacteroides abscessus]SLG27366.1 ABC transporter permease [Mycobacteroides abscessus subsp. abscessus]
MTGTGDSAQLAVRNNDTAVSLIIQRESLTEIIHQNLSRTIPSSLRTLGRVVAMTIESVVGVVSDVVSARLQWREMIRQSWYLVTVAATPAVLMAVPFGVVVSVQVGNIVHQVGADSLLGAAGGLGVIQQGAPLAAGLLLGGAGTATIAADLGARTVREEVDALETLGISALHRLVIPRVLAMLMVAPLLNILIIVTSVLSGYAVAAGVQNVSPGAYWASFGAFATVADLWISLAKAALFGFIVAIVACQRGLEVKGGPRGVADGVNAAVVLSILAIAVVNVAITQLVTMFTPIRIA